MKIKEWFQKNVTYRFNWVDFGFLFMLTVVFFALPVFLAPDSLTYLNNAYVLDGKLPWSSWDGMRGPTLPAFLWLSFDLFGESTFGSAVALYLLYLVFVGFTMYLFHLLGFMRLFKKAGSWAVCCVLLFLNPTMLTYSHYVLTEFMAQVLVVIATVITVKTHQLLARSWGMYTPNQETGDKSPAEWKVRAVRYIGAALLLMITYGVKQMFFVFVLAPLFLSELLLLIGRFSLKRVVISGISLLLVGGSLFLWTAGWDGIVRTNGHPHETFNAQNLAQSTIIDGLRYFRPTERGTVGVPIEIEVMSNSYTEVQKTFTYTFDGTFAGSLHYLGTCFIKAPERFVTSWVHNYFVITNVRRVIGYDMGRAYFPVSQTNHFFLSFENEAWLERFKYMEQGSTGYDPSMPSGNPQFEQMLDNGLVSNLLFNTAYPSFSYFLYSFPAFCALPLFLAGFIGSILRRKSKGVEFWNTLALLAGSVFLSILFLAVTASNIDRYGVPASAWCALLFLFVVTAGGKLLWQKGRPILLGLFEGRKKK